MSNVGIQEDRPPYVTFETRAEEDRQASIDQGQMVYRNVDYAIITPRGSKDRIERVALEWLAHIDREARQDRFDPKWVAGYRENYKFWKDGQEAPVDGTPLTQWPGLSPAQVKNFHNINVKSVEDVAAANEETLSRMGMGARDLKNRAINWLQSAKEVGKVAEQFSALQAENTRLGELNDALIQKQADLERRLAFLETGGITSYDSGRHDDNATPDVDFS